MTTEREKFEEYVRSKYRISEDYDDLAIFLEFDEDGGFYVNPAMQIRFQAWQACAEQKQAEIDALLKEIDRLNVALNPREWDQQINDLWHRNIPDLLAAFDAIRNNKD